MAKGFIRGVLWGAGVSFGAVVLMSVAGDSPSNSISGQLAPERSPGIVADKSQTKGSKGNRVALDAGVPAPDTLASIGTDAFDSANVPQTGFASVLPDTELPDVASKPGDAATATDSPTVTTTVVGSLTTPDTEPDLSISTQPAQPLAPAASQQQTAFEESDSSNAPQVATSVLAPEPASTPGVTSIDTDPVLSAEPKAPSTEMAFAQEVMPATESEVAQMSASVEVETKQKIASSAAPVAMSKAPEVSTPQTTTDIDELEDTPAFVDETPKKDPLADTPQPQASTEVVLALAQPSQSSIPQILTETDAPEILLLDNLDAPTQSDVAQTEGESTSASVSVKIALDGIAPSPEVSSEPAMKPVLPPQTVARTETAPDAVEAGKPDQAATADASSTTPPSPPSKESPVVAQQMSREVKVNRLPTLGAATETEQDSAEPEVSSTPQIAGASSVRPIERYGTAFENPENKPVMAVVLMDTGVDLSQDEIGLTALRQLPYPVSFAVDAGLPDAAERMRAYRAEGFEVLAMVDLPEGATAADAEVNLSVALEKLPEVVGVMEGVSTGLQTTRDSGRQVADILAQTGHGFITQNKGLNTVQKLAARQGVPSAVVFRDFDSKGQSARVISRFFDQAAFRSGQEGAVIMLGRMREETIAALLVWALQDRAARVALAPASGALLSATQ